MHSTPASQRSINGRTSWVDYDPAEHALDRLTPSAGAGSALCLVLLMLLMAF
jgi:hypothetical protein